MNIREIWEDEQEKRQFNELTLINRLIRPNWSADRIRNVPVKIRTYNISLLDLPEQLNSCFCYSTGVSICL